MTKVKFLQSISGMGEGPCGKQFPNFYFPEGYVGDLLNDAIAEAWIASGICELADHTHVCRPPKPEFAVAITPEEAIAKRGRGRPKAITIVTIDSIDEVSE